MTTNHFTEEYRHKLDEAWERFIAYDNGFDYSFIRPFIFESWQRSRSHNVNPRGRLTFILPQDEIEKRLKENSLLIEVARPYMERLYSVVEGSGYYLLLSDRDGYVLDLIGDQEIIEQGKESFLVVGAHRAESVAGTNAIGTCLEMKNPVQIWAGEHFIDRHKFFSCSCAPIFGQTNEVIGCLNITGQYTQVHSHTLGMVLSSVDGISKQIALRQAYDEIESLSLERNSVLESVSSGLILLDEEDRVVQLNGSARRMLHLVNENPIGFPLDNFISSEDQELPLHFCRLQSEYNNEEITFQFSNGHLPPEKFRITTKFVGDAKPTHSTVIRLEESRYINTLVNKVSGFKASFTFESIIGSSPATKTLIAVSQRAARSSSNVLIIGESGTGKELVAQSIHNASSYASGPFVAINCAALPKGLIESELFGYEKGSFTGANKEGNPGKFELADGGTIFLDEIGDMPLDVQASLLRVIQSKEITRIGGKRPKKIDVRIIAATNKNLIDSVAEKIFRQDLYYRLNVLFIQVPPLRDRENDIIELAHHFTKILNSPHQLPLDLSEEVHPVLLKHRWPGNIRELENVIERAINITEDGIIRANHLPDYIRTSGNPLHAPATETLADNWEATDLDYESNGRLLILASLEKTRGNVKLAAEVLGISRRTLYRKMEKYQIDYSEYR